MLSDIEIASAAKMLPIDQIAQDLGVLPEELEPYGRYKAKLAESIYKRLANRENGKLVLVTAINPTPAGEGKTTTTVGLGEAMRSIGKKAMIALREPSLGPVFGVKGGAAGGGYCPGCAHGGHQPPLHRGYARHHRCQQPALRPASTTTSSRAMRWASTRAGSSGQALPGYERPRPAQHHRSVWAARSTACPGRTASMITVASEVMAILCLAADLRRPEKASGRYSGGLHLCTESRCTARDLQGRGRDGSPAQGRHQAQPGPDPGEHPGPDARRPVCQHRPRLQLGARHQDWR